MRHLAGRFSILVTLILATTACVENTGDGSACPECGRLAKTTEEGPSTLIVVEPFTDAAGNEHVHDLNTQTMHHRCAAWHEWATTRYGSCWCGWPEELEVRRLEAIGTCTARACPGSHPCCNACGHDGWQIAGAPGAPLHAVERLPTCVPDGCGECEFDLEARGVTDERGFRLVDWKEVPRTKRFSGPGRQQGSSK